jgi:hypothetical protein
MSTNTPEEIALEQIKEAEMTGATKLDLKLGLSFLPKQIGNLHNLVLQRNVRQLT